MDLRKPLPPTAELMANGARLLVTMILREMPYPEYLTTEHWRQMREAAFRAHGRRCFICLRTRQIEIHHVTYENLGDEKPEDIVPLCREHHQLQHDILKLQITAQLSARL